MPRFPHAARFATISAMIKKTLVLLALAVTTADAQQVDGIVLDPVQ